MAFGKYELLRRMRVGGMAEVFRACEPPDRDRALAIKRILPSFTDEADYVAMFIDEARLSMRFQHDGIVRAYELGQVDDEYYIALEYIDGQDVATVLARARETSQPLPVAIACRIALDVCAALEYAHALRGDKGEPLGIVHRDVSPQNVLISYAGDVKLIDFGIAKSTEQLMRTQAGLLKGKYGYLSPEQARGQTLDRRSDLFSLGVCLYEMLSATRLFEGKNDFSTMRKVREGEILPLHRRNANVPPALSAIVQRALARQRNDRFQTAGEMAVALQGFVRAANHRCNREQLAQFMRERFRDESVAAAAEQDAAADPSTGLLEAFEGLEPRSSVSQMAVAPPMPEEVSNDLLQTADSEDEAEKADTNPPQPEPVRAIEHDVDESDDGPEDEPTRVVAYSSTASGELAEQRARPRRDSSIREHAATAPDDTTRARRHPSSPSHARASMPAPASQPALPALQRSEEPLREPVAQSSMDWDEDEFSTHIYDAPDKSESGQHAAMQLQIEAPAPQSAAWEDARDAHAARASSAAPRAHVQTLRPLPSDPVPSASRVATLRPAAHGAAHERAPTPQVASIRPVAVISAAPTPRIASIRPVAAPAAVVPSMSQPPVPAEYAVAPRASRSLTTKRIAVLSWFPKDPARRPRAVAIASAAVCVLVAIAVVLIGRAPEPSTIQIATEPVDAAVTLDGVELAGSTSPFVFTHVKPDVPHVVEVSKPGYRSWTTTIILRSGRELKPPVVRLARDESAAPVAMVPRAAAQPPSTARPVVPVPALPRIAPVAQPERRPAAPRPVHVSRGGKRSQPNRVAAPKPAPPAPAPLANPQPTHIVTVAPVSRGDGTGKLRINSRPWSQVYVDGRLIGNTPRTDLVLSAGVHTVTLISPDFGYKRVLAVPIKRGETVTKIVDLAN